MEIPLLFIAANGHYCLSFEESADEVWHLAKAELTRLGFRNSGNEFGDADSRIFSSFVKGDLEICAGSDIWSGRYMLSETAEGDEILLSLSKLVSAMDNRRPREE